MFDVNKISDLVKMLIDSYREGNIPISKLFSLIEEFGVQENLSAEVMDIIFEGINKSINEIDIKRFEEGMNYYNKTITPSKRKKPKTKQPKFSHLGGLIPPEMKPIMKKLYESIEKFPNLDKANEYFLHSLTPEEKEIFDKDMRSHERIAAPFDKTGKPFGNRIPNSDDFGTYSGDINDKKMSEEEGKFDKGIDEIVWELPNDLNSLEPTDLGEVDWDTIPDEVFNSIDVNEVDALIEEEIKRLRKIKNEIIKRKAKGKKTD